MSAESLAIRMDGLERRVEILEQLPERVTALEVQIVELRDEMRSEFSATRAMIRAGDEGVISTLREEIRTGDERTTMTLREEIRSGDEETRRYMRVLHEDLVGRIAALREGP